MTGNAINGNTLRTNNLDTASAVQPGIHSGNSVIVSNTVTGRGNAGVFAQDSGNTTISGNIPPTCESPAPRSREPGFRVLARPAGFEPATVRLEGGCSIQLS